MQSSSEASPDIRGVNWAGQARQPTWAWPRRGTGPTRPTDIQAKPGLGPAPPRVECGFAKRGPRPARVGLGTCPTRARHQARAGLAWGSQRHRRADPPA